MMCLDKRKILEVLNQFRFRNDKAININYIAANPIIIKFIFMILQIIFN